MLRCYKIVNIRLAVAVIIMEVLLWEVLDVRTIGGMVATGVAGRSVTI